MNIDNFNLRLVSSHFGKRIKVVPRSPKEVSHNLVQRCMKNKVRRFLPIVSFFEEKYNTVQVKIS